MMILMRLTKKLDYKEQNVDGCATSYLVRMKEQFIHESLVKILYTQPFMPEGAGHLVNMCR